MGALWQGGPYKAPQRGIKKHFLKPWEKKLPTASTERQAPGCAAERREGVEARRSRMRRSGARQCYLGFALFLTIFFGKHVLQRAF